MKLEECYKRLDRYIQSSDKYPRLVNVNNSDSMNSICTHYNVGTNKFKNASEFANFDEIVSEPKLLNYLSKETDCVFIKGITTFYKLLGYEQLQNFLNKIVSRTYKAKIIILCYQCNKELKFSDIRSNDRVYLIDGDNDTKPELIFCKPDCSTLQCVVDGINNISDYIELKNISPLIIKTNKKKENYPHSLFEIHHQGNSYQQLCEIDSLISNVNESLGNIEQWNYALEVITPRKSFYSYVEEKFVSIKSLELSFQNWKQFNKNEKWMYFLALKCFGTQKNGYLEVATKLSNKLDDLVVNIFNGLLSVDYTDKDFWKRYDERKNLIKILGEQPIHYISDYCNWTLSKKEKALYYLTDETEIEIYLIFKILNDYHELLDKNEVVSILYKIYPNLYYYLMPYDYKIELLNRYFNEYKYQKVTNYISSEFMKLVEEQAIKRDYNALLPARWEKTEGIADNQTLVYFIDAMGVEYLSFILAQCKDNNLLASVTICHSEIPSLTCENTEFREVFKNAGASFANGEKGYKKLDDIKHHGEESFSDYTKEQLPVHLAKELQILSELIRNVAKELQSENYKKVILISDHGASRLAVIKEQELQYEMSEKGKHSGRCCLKSETDIQPECSMNSDKYWVITNYGRFKGGRKANVEVHGGATLEEVVIPIIEIFKRENNYEFKLESTEIKFSKRKKNAHIKLFSKSKLKRITISVANIDKRLDVISTDGHYFNIQLPELKSTGNYTLDVYLEDNLLVNGIKFKAINTDFVIKDIL